MGERSLEELRAMGILSESERNRIFAELRERTLKEVENETRERVKKNPKPSEEELIIGAFQEMLEPQVREAVFELYRKGYSTESSGFGGNNGEIQQIDGYFEIDQTTEEKLKSFGVQVVRNKINKAYTSIRFQPEKADLNQIKNKWQQIVEILPKKERSAQISISGASEHFRQQFAPERTDLRRAMIQRRLALEEISPEVTQQLKQELQQLSVPNY